MKKVELLAPAGSLEKLKMAIIYGADAVYVGGECFSLRAFAENFTFEELIGGIEFVKSHNKKIYLTMNVFLKNKDIENVKIYLDKIKDLKLDGIIFSDPGMYLLIKEKLPNMELHLSTQANNTNYMSAKFWADLGVKRIVLARELTLNEICEIKDNIPDGIEIEAFVHGAMCISYSGRCLLSNYMNDRDSNQGLCAQPCRWKYSLVEEKRPNEYYPVFEDENGTYIFNSKDLCLIEHIPELIESGICSFKIEGRMKSSFYVATIISAYRSVIDSYYKDKDKFKFDSRYLDEVKKVSHRQYTSGFYFADTALETRQVYSSSSYIRGYDFVGIVKEYNKELNLIKIEQRNKISVGETIEIISPNGIVIEKTLDKILDVHMKEIDSAPHAQMIFYINIDENIPEYSMLRKKV